jgi:hypothetical protein
MATVLKPIAAAQNERGIAPADSVASTSKNGQMTPAVVEITTRAASAVAGGDRCVLRRTGGLGLRLNVYGADSAVETDIRNHSDDDLQDRHRHNQPDIAAGESSRCVGQFPRVLFVRATRELAMSVAKCSHNQLANIGAESESRLSDGLGHAFIVDDLAEAEDANCVIVNFLDEHLGRKALKSTPPG